MLYIDLVTSIKYNKCINNRREKCGMPRVLRDIDQFIFAYREWTQGTKRGQILEAIENKYGIPKSPALRTLSDWIKKFKA